MTVRTPPRAARARRVAENLHAAPRQRSEVQVFFDRRHRGTIHSP
jgi:hypothetical protein